MENQSILWAQFLFIFFALGRTEIQATREGAGATLAGFVATPDSVLRTDLDSAQGATCGAGSLN